MENLSTNMLVMLIAIAVAAVALIVWLVYRNMKDAKDFEKGMDNPNREIERDRGEKV